MISFVGTWDILSFTQSVINKSEIILQIEQSIDIILDYLQQRYGMGPFVLFFSEQTNSKDGFGGGSAGFENVEATVGGFEVWGAGFEKIETAIGGI